MSKPAWQFSWSELAFADKGIVRDLRATFVLAPRDLTTERITALVKSHLPQGNLIIGLASEPYVTGFEGQPQFKTLALSTVEPIVEKVWKSPAKHKVYTLTYDQRDIDYIIDKCRFTKVLLIRGSWLSAFHNRSTYHLLRNKQVSFSFESPFTDELAARDYENVMWPEMIDTARMPSAGSKLTALQMMHSANAAARLSYDYSYQTGIVAGFPHGPDYKFLDYGYNRVVPFQTYALLYGNSREEHFSPPQDQNHYDTVHAEVDLILQAQKHKLSLAGSTIFINLLPCPTCARMLATSDIQELVYTSDHSDGYAVKMLELAGKTVRRLIP